jgi:nucleoid DNA-binding protein
MDKPISMSVKDYLVRTLAVKILTSEKTIEAVINHQFQSANEALEENNSVEISGFGKLMFNTKKATKKLEALDAKVKAMEKILADDDISDQRRNAATVTLANTHITISQIKAKLSYESK